MRSLIPRRKDDEFLRIVEELEIRLTENYDFSRVITENLVETIEAEDVAREIDASDIAYNIDMYDLVQHFDVDDIAYYVRQNLDTAEIVAGLDIDAGDVAEYMDALEVANCIDFDYDEITNRIDRDDLQLAQVDEDSIMNKVIEEVVSRLEGN
jgi:hypothetical protein